MGTFVELGVDAESRVGTIRLRRPPMNALSAQVWSAIGDAVLEAAERDDVGAVVIWGGQEVFAAGGDIREFPTWDYRRAKATGTHLQRALDSLARMPKITIAAINGYALGGGCELAMACDFRYVAEDATLGQPEIRLGLIPGGGGTQRLPRLVGLSRAKELIFSGRMIDAVESSRIGLADAVFPATDVYHEASSAAATYARGAHALRLAKQALADGYETNLEQGLRLERDLFAQCFRHRGCWNRIRDFRGAESE